MDAATAIETPSATATSHRRAVRVAWLLWAAAMVPSAIGLALLAVTRDVKLPDAYGFRGFISLFALTLSSVGAVIVARHVGHRIGLVFATAGIIAGVGQLATEYATYGLVFAPGAPGAIWAAWLSSWLYLPLVLLAGPIFLSIFPDGHFLSRRWRIPAILAVIAGSFTAFGNAFRIGPLENSAFATNPMGILTPGSVKPAGGIWTVLLIVALLLSAASVVVRYRHASQDERQQLKWVAFAAVVVALVGPLGFVGGKAGQIAFIVAFCGIPISAGVAVMRYGLYEIDTIINRAVVYGLLTAILAGLYAATVGLMQRLLQGVAGANSDAAVIMTTVIVVSAFTPVRARLQRLVDRRFKEKGDPSTRLSAFTRTLFDRLWLVDSDRALARFLQTAVEAYASPGGSISVAGPDGRRQSASIGVEIDEHAIVFEASHGGTTIRMLLAPPPGTLHLTDRDRGALEQAMSLVAGEVSASP